MGIGERESRRYWGQQLVVRGQLHSPLGKLVMRVAHVAPIRARCFNSKRTSFHVALELEHVESVDLRSEVRKADAVLPVFARAGQRSDTLKRVARRGRCRLLFLLGVQHITQWHSTATSPVLALGRDLVATRARTFWQEPVLQIANPSRSAEADTRDQRGRGVASTVRGSYLSHMFTSNTVSCSGTALSSGLSGGGDDAAPGTTQDRWAHCAPWHWPPVPPRRRAR